MNIFRIPISFLSLLLFTTMWAEQRKPSGSHSLRYTFLLEPLPGVPQYSVVGYVDEVPIISFTSEIGRAEPRAPWMENITNKEPHFWEVSSDLFEDVKKTLNDSLRNLEQKSQPPGAEPRRVRTPEGSPFFIPTMNLTSALVMWGGTHAPDCKGAPIITVLLGEPWSFTPALGDRVRKGLYGGSIVIDDASKSDEGFYSLCSSSSQPLLVIEVVLTEPHPAVTDPPDTITTVADPHGRSWRGRLLVLVASLMTLLLAGVLILNGKPLYRFLIRHHEGQRTREARPSAELNEKGLVMLPHPLTPHHHKSDRDGSCTGSDVGSSTRKDSDEAVVVNADTDLIETSEVHCT